jgi:hypothetical protein
MTGEWLVSDLWNNEDEQLATFLDGRLGERARAKMIEHLTEADDAYQVFACTAVILCEALLQKMQTPEARAAMRHAFDAAPGELRQAAIEAARNCER